MTTQITRNTSKAGTGPSDWFTGAVYVDTLATPSAASMRRCLASLPFRLVEGDSCCRADGASTGRSERRAAMGLLRYELPIDNVG